MKLVSKFTLIHSLCLVSLTAIADDLTNQYSNQMQGNLKTITKYLEYLGGYLGYDLTKSPKETEDKKISSELLSPSTTQLAENYVYNTFIGAFPIVALGGAMAQLVPSSAPGANLINKLANITFQNYNESSSQQGKISVNDLIDQKTYQQDPVSQTVLNILGTPDYSYCNNTANQQIGAHEQCKYLYGTKVMTNVLGPIPTSKELFSYDYNQQIIGQLNVNSLLGSLQYSDENTNQNNTSSSPNATSNETGLTSQNQAQQAANFIRYVTGAVAPGPQPHQEAYDKLYFQALPTQGMNVTSIQKEQALSVLTNYLTSLRVFAAQSSVGASNLYYLLAKRIPQNQSGGTNSILTSQALSEFNMASWRLFNPDLSPNKQWVNQLNNASSATVAKEIATLLAEMNYQMYLERQLQERILLTNSIMLIQNTRAAQPNANFNNQP